MENTASNILYVAPLQVKNKDISSVENAIKGSGGAGNKLFTIDFRFTKDENGSKELNTDEWVTMRAYEDWFYELGKQLPYAIFFLKQWHHRMLVMAADLMREGKVQVDIEDKKLHFVFDDEEIDILDKRVIHSCMAFKSLAEQNNIPPEEPINNILTEFKSASRYDDLQY
jgi:hypothetical protein